MYLNWSSEAWAKFHKEHRGLILKVHQRVGFCNALDGSEDCKIEFKEGKGSFNMNLVISVQIFLFSNFSNMRSTRVPNTRKWSSPFGTSFQMTKAAVKGITIYLATFWLHFGWLLMRFWQIIFLKGQMTSDRDEIFFFITKQILLHNFYWPDFISNDFIFQAYFLKHFGWICQI